MYYSCFEFVKLHIILYSILDFILRLVFDQGVPCLRCQFISITASESHNLLNNLIVFYSINYYPSNSTAGFEFYVWFVYDTVISAFVAIDTVYLLCGVILNKFAL